jgi:hypothetical protein
VQPRASLPDPCEAIRSDNHPNCFRSVRLLARDAFEVAVGHRPIPTWRGGPVGG